MNKRRYSHSARGETRSKVPFFARFSENGLLSVEVLTLAYMLITAVMTLVWWDNINRPEDMMVWRAGALAFMVLSNIIYHFYPSRFTITLRVVPLLLCLIQWYPETYEFCKQFNYQDHIFAFCDWLIFGCQPGVMMQQWLSSDAWYEAFCLGYYSYYYLMMLTIGFILFARYDDFQRASFIFLGSFFLFYLIYEFLPVAGPQYYYCAIGLDRAQEAYFPEMGHYFVDHQDCLPVEDRGLFSRLVWAAHETGEHPTAAFPSSHVGMATISMMLAWQTRCRWLFWLQVPFYLLLVVSTVYVRAHYAIDSIAGLVFAFVFFGLTHALWPGVRGLLRLKD